MTKGDFEKSFAGSEGTVSIKSGNFSLTVAMKVEADGSMKPYPMSKTSDGSLYIFVKEDMRFTLQEPKKMNFEDTAGHGAQSAIDFVTARDIMVGTEKGSFSPNTPMTRGMFVTMLYKMSGAPEATGEGLKAYTDAHMVSDWSEEALTSLIDAGLLTGDSKRSLNPKGHATRGEAATLIFRLNP